MPKQRVPYCVEFPPDTLLLIDKLAGKLQVSREVVIAKGLGLIDLWVDARDDDRMFIECPRRKVNKKADEFEIDIM